VLIDTDAPAGYRLGWADRQEIALGYNRGESMTVIAARIKRPVCTVSREIKRNVSPDGVYRLTDAHRDSVARAKRTKPAKLAQPGRLRDYVVAQLKKKRSPEQIASRIALEYPDDPEMRVCHETIYQAIYIQARGGLKREVDKALRRGRGYRKPQRKPDTRRTRVPDELLISQRPDDVADRLIPGHWEGDLILGSVASGSAVATLVERSTRFVMLGHLPADHTATTVRDAIVPLLAGLPDQMRKTLTWDQGSEMACHLQIAEQADINVYFAHPHSPWERGTNEATNGLLRQYLPKGTDLSIYTPTDLQAIADELNSRPRKTLGWLTPEEAWHLTLGHTITIGGRQMALPDTLQPLQQRCIHP
jgi:IS30 family transposase